MKTTLQNDTIPSRESLESFYNKLDIQVISNKNSLILTEEHGVPPRIKFFLQIFKDAPALKNLRKFNTTTKSIHLLFELNNILRLGKLSKDLKLVIVTLPMNGKIQLIT